MRTNSDITIYNKYVDSGEEMYQRTVVKDTEWENRAAANKLASGGSIKADTASIYIPFARNHGYLAPKAWQDDRSGNWTLKTGDFIVKGEVDDEISSVFTISDLKSDYDDVVKITSVDTHDFGSLSMQHWEVNAK